MGSWSPTIMGGDDQLDALSYLISMCGIDYNDYLEDKKVLTKKKIENNLELIMKNLDIDDYIYLQVFGILVLETGSYLSDDLKQMILNSIDYEFSQIENWGEDIRELRKLYLNDYKNKILSYDQIQKTHLLELKNLNNDVELKKTCIGIKNFYKLMESKERDSIINLNLDSSRLESIPEQVFSLESLEILSIENNSIRAIPKSIGRLLNLKEIYLGNNSISMLPESFTNLESLEVLSLFENNFNQVPKYLTNQQLLWELDLSYNNIEYIPKNILKLSSLNSISLKKNNLKIIPSFLEKNPNIKGDYFIIRD